MLWKKETHGIWGAHRRGHVDYIFRVRDGVFWEDLAGEVSFNVQSYKQIVYKSISSLRNKKRLAGFKS